MKYTARQSNKHTTYRQFSLYSIAKKQQEQPKTAAGIISNDTTSGKKNEQAQNDRNTKKKYLHSNGMNDESHTKTIH